MTENSRPLIPPLRLGGQQAVVFIKKRPQRQGAQRLLKTRRTDLKAALPFFPRQPYVIGTAVPHLASAVHKTCTFFQ